MTDMDMLDGDSPAPREGGLSVAARLLLGGTALTMVAAGLVLWSARGPVIFTDMLSAAIAWCF
jgi:hypothetical protein